jgi:hypothetical protein
MDLYMQRSRMEGDGTLGSAVFSELKKRIQDRDRAGDLMGTMSAMGMIYFCSIEAATAEMVQRDLRIQATEAELVVDACRQAVAALEQPERHPQRPEMVMALTAQATKARATKGTAKGAKAPAQKSLATNSPLQVALSLMKTSRKTKPRKTGVIDEAVWEGSVVTIKGRLQDKFNIGDLEKHYGSMCALGQSLLAAEIHREAQTLYDYRVGKLMYRANRRRT